MVQTEVPLPHLDVRTLANSLRTMFTGVHVLTLVPVPDASSIVVTGPGSQVHDLARMLLATEAAAAR